VDGGVWQADSAPHRLAKFLDARVYANADGVIALSNRAKAVIETFPVVRRNKAPVVVVPSCVDLERFRVSAHGLDDQSAGLRFVYIGSIGKRYILDKIGSFVAAAMEKGSAHLRVLTQYEPAKVKSMLNAGGLSDNAWSADRIPHAEMPEELARHHAGLHFLPQGLSDHGGSPTKIGEYWATGLPVVVTPGIGDTEEIIRRDRAGVVVTGHSEAAYQRAVSELKLLLADRELPTRCRRVAEKHYSLGSACESQISLYHELVSEAARSPARA
jgi:glycosyltransferase involved in cell wall biosynthesis